MELQSSAVGTKVLPYTQEAWKIPGYGYQSRCCRLFVMRRLHDGTIAGVRCCRYTGHIAGMGEVYAKTPIASQLECVEPATESFIYTRKLVPPRAMPDRDPCNRPEDALKHQPSTVCTVLARHLSYKRSALAHVSIVYLQRTFGLNFSTRQRSHPSDLHGVTLQMVT
jgi:hypothetical protein